MISKYPIHYLLHSPNFYLCGSRFFNVGSDKKCNDWDFVAQDNKENIHILENVLGMRRLSSHDYAWYVNKIYRAEYENTSVDVLLVKDVHVSLMATECMLELGIFDKLDKATRIRIIGEFCGAIKNFSGSREDLLSALKVRYVPDFDGEDPF